MINKSKLFSGALATSFAFCMLVPTTSFAMPLGQYFDGMNECDVSGDGNIDEGEMLCLDELWITASEDCVLTGSQEDCWLSDDTSYPIDSVTGQSSIMSLSDLDMEEFDDPNAGIQALTYDEWNQGVETCRTMGQAGAGYFAACISLLTVVAYADCYNYGGEHCFW